MHAARSGDGTIGVILQRYRCTEDRHDRVADELHHRPALARDRAVHRSPVLVELSGQHARVGALSDGGVAADVRTQHRDLELIGLPDRTSLRAQQVGDAARQQAGQRFALLLAVDDGLVPGRRASAPRASHDVIVIEVETLHAGKTIRVGAALGEQHHLEQRTIDRVLHGGSTKDLCRLRQGVLVDVDQLFGHCRLHRCISSLGLQYIPSDLLDRCNDLGRRDLNE
jgi:hypothetical protein